MAGAVVLILLISVCRNICGYKPMLVRNTVTESPKPGYNVSMVLHVDPDTRSIVFAYALPAARITSLCWGGPRLDVLFVTSSREAPLGGAVFTLRGTGRRGLPPNRFKFNNADRY